MWFLAGGGVFFLFYGVWESDVGLEEKPRRS